MSEEKINEAEVKDDGSENIDKPDESGDKVDAPEVDSEIDKASESVMNELSKKDKKREDKQLREENRKLTAKNKELGDSLEKAQKEHDELQDKYLRVCAEYDNFRKRTQKERDGIFTDAYSDALKEILPIFDNLERAALYTEPDKLTEGLELIFKSAKEMLTKLGVEEFGAVGEKFDPNIHNAVMHIEDESVGEEEIIEVFQKGYKRGDKIIRHAMVKVAN
ncbi:MAG TPA: nucleotide exchange factor GrpE [Firmicutes bacterium]|nr:nucleotide exchange factor GrpE [Bacillota bacterium]